MYKNEAVVQLTHCGHGKISVVLYAINGAVKRVLNFPTVGGYQAARTRAIGFTAGYNADRGKLGWSSIILDQCTDCIRKATAPRL